MNDGEEKQYISENSEEIATRVKKIKRALKKCRAEKAEYLLGWQRAQADFQNYKKRLNAEFDEAQKFANKNLILKTRF